MPPDDITHLFQPPHRGAGAWRGSVCAAVLTYNRKDMLALCLVALRAQRDPPDRIVVVDNASTDGTEVFLREEGYFDDPRFAYVRLDRNIGASAGFERLFREVWRSGADWGWFMDDDVVAAPDALAQLKAAFAEQFHRPEEVGFLVSTVVTPDGKLNDVPIVDERKEPRTCAEWGEYLASGLVRVRSCALNSVLIPRSTLTSFGAPSLDFVVWGEDTDYCMRVTEERPGYIVGRSRVVHLRGVSGDLDIFTEPAGPRLDRFYYLYRNTMYLRRRFWPRRAVYLFLLKTIGHFFQCLAFPSQPMKRALLVLRGTLAGLFFTPRYVPIDGSSRGATPLGPADERFASHRARLLHAEER